MVNPERLHNAIAAIDILARADATAFTHGMNVSGEIAQDATDVAGLRRRLSELKAEMQKLERGELTGDAKWKHQRIEAEHDRIEDKLRDAARGRSDAALTPFKFEAANKRGALHDLKKKLSIAREHNQTERVASLQREIERWEQAFGRADKLEPAKPGTPGFGRNIAREIKAGKPSKQAEAIAYSKARGDAVSTAYREGRAHAQKKGPAGRSDNPWIGRKERAQWEAGFESWMRDMPAPKSAS